MTALLPALWGLAAAWFAARARALRLRRRARALVPPPRAVPGRARVYRLAGVRRAVELAAQPSRRARQVRALRRDVPVAIELVRVASGSGLAPAQALRAVSAAAPASVASRLERALRSAGLGQRLADALEAAGSDAVELAPLTSALAASLRLGTPLEGPLRRLADETRAAARRDAEARARTVPVRLLFPLVLLVLPAFGLLAVVPAVLAGFRS